LNINKNLAHKKSGADQQILLRTHQIIILPTLRYRDATYGSVSPTTLKTLGPVHHKGERLALGIFAVCRTENVLHEQDKTKISIRFITNEIHPIRSYFMNNKIHDKYATKPRAIKPKFIRTIEYFWVNYR
jgi:hypothetical protein